MNSCPNDGDCANAAYMESVSFASTRLEDTVQIASAFEKKLQAGDVILLRGELGAGKSAFARALIHARAGAAIEVPSPTYTLVQTYAFPGAIIYHYDLYRIGEPNEVYELEWEEAHTNGICLVEWPERLGHLTPKTQCLMVDIQHKHGEERLLTFSSGDANVADRLSDLKEILNNLWRQYE